MVVKVRRPEYVCMLCIKQRMQVVTFSRTRTRISITRKQARQTPGDRQIQFVVGNAPARAGCHVSQDEYSSQLVNEWVNDSFYIPAYNIGPDHNTALRMEQWNQAEKSANQPTNQQTNLPTDQPSRQCKNVCIQFCIRSVAVVRLQIWSGLCSTLALCIPKTINGL